MEYTVYETRDRGVGHPCAVYSSISKMAAAWLAEFKAGTHCWMVTDNGWVPPKNVLT